MPNRETRSVRVDPDIWSQFIGWVEEKEGQKHGEIGRHVETALQEYIDGGRGARLENKLDRVLARIDSQQDSHTHKNASETVEKARDIFRRVTDNHGTVIRDDDLVRAIEDIAGADPRTVEKYKDILKRRDLLFQHPSESPVWTPEQDRWVSWAEPYVDSNPTVEVMDLIEDYSITSEQYEERVERIDQIH